MDSQNECENKKCEAKHDPGWNDPPTFSYNAQPVPGAKPRLSLNKRVAFPLQGTNLNTNVPTVNNQMPPIGQIPPPLIAQVPPSAISQAPSMITTPQNIPNLNNQETTDVCRKEFCELSIDEEPCDVEEVVGILDDILEKNAELGNKIEDIKRRINTMKTMWTEGKLAKSIQISMLKLSKALQHTDTKTADEIHKSLMVDHISSVSSWMVGIKQLILHCTAKNELLNIDKD